MAAKPGSLNECFVRLEQILPQEKIDAIRNLQRDQLWELQFSLGPIIQTDLLDNNPALQERLGQACIAACRDESDLPLMIAQAFWDYLQ
jgi:hypothetical protein